MLKKIFKIDIEKLNENKIIFFTINVFFAILLFVANKITPYLVDDLTYMNVLGTNPPQRIANIKDCLVSLIYLYKKWTGRVVPHFLDFFFFIFDKNVFNILNSLIYILFVLLIYKWTYIFEEKQKINNSYLLLIYSLIWLFLPGSNTVYLWQTCSLNYFWTSLFFLLWFIPYFKYSILNKNTNLYNNIIFTILYFVASFILGLSHEAQNGAILFGIMVCFVIQKFFYNKNIKLWQILGFIGLVLGTVIVFLAPGNIIRSNHVGNWSNNIFIDKFLTFARLLLFSFATRPIYVPTIIICYYIFYKYNKINNLFDKQNVPNIFFIVFYLGSIFEYMLVSGKAYTDRCMTLTSFICIIYLMIVINNCLFDKNKKLFIYLSIFLCMQTVFSIVHGSYRLTGLSVFK